MVLQLLAHQADMKFYQRLLLEAVTNDSTDIVQLLLPSGCSVNETHANKTAVCCAAELGLVKTAEVLLRYGAGVTQDASLWFATRSNDNIAMVELLMKHGAVYRRL